jgi:peptide/nickel transport system substrate-binding protein
VIPRGSSLRIALAGFVLVLGVIPLALAGATAKPSTNDNNKTLTISLPGPFNGCTFLDAGATPTTDAILDLVRPSAFLTSSAGNLYGEGGPIASAELTSLKPETVVYTIAAHQVWSNFVAFTASDLVSWWEQARTLSSVKSDGYRAISSLNVTNGGLSVTAVFATPYAEWNLLFRDVEANGTSAGCAIGNLMSRPSLGPYVVTSATTSRIVLAMNKLWTLSPNRFGHIVITDSESLPSASHANFAGYTLDVDRTQEEALSAHPSELSHIGTSSNIEELTYAPGRPLTSQLAVREALSWSLNRQAMINELWGAVTFSPSVAQSAIFSQGQTAYPGTNGAGPTGQTATTTTTLPVAGSPPGLGDCLACALDVLKTAGFTHTARGLVQSSGAVASIRVAVGPSILDQATAELVIKRWQDLGFTVTSESVASDELAAAAAAHNKVDVAVIARPTMTTPSYVARSWSGPAYVDSYPSGVRSSSLTSLYNTAITNFNPVAANATWLSLDKAIMTSFWVRPLFTAPSLVEWSSSLAEVVGSLSVPGFLDQVTTWTISPASTQG